jgi:hypothetical protein
MDRCGNAFAESFGYDLIHLVTEVATHFARGAFPRALARGLGTELECKHRMKLDAVGRDATLAMDAIEEPNAGDSHRDSPARS